MSGSVTARIILRSGSVRVIRSRRGRFFGRVFCSSGGIVNIAAFDVLHVDGDPGSALAEGTGDNVGGG